MGSDCAAGRGATPSEVVWVLAPVISIICAMAFFGARRFGLIGGRPAAADRRPEAFAADLVVSHPLKVIALNVWLITALSVLCGNQPVCRVRGIDTATPSSRRRVDGVEVMIGPWEEMRRDI